MINNYSESKYLLEKYYEENQKLKNNLSAIKSLLREKEKAEEHAAIMNLRLCKLSEDILFE